MTAESQVSISFAISLFSDEIYNPDDDRLNYQSYEKLGLICGQCRELIFFKKGTERVSHFSHFKTTGKDCQWRTGSDSNTLHTDAEGREQSLEKFQTKFKSIIEQGIIKHQQILSSQLREQIKEGQRLVSTYKIDIESWLRWFNQNRKEIRNIAQGLYQKNELVCEKNLSIILNFVDYLCVLASESILRDILYYVFSLLDRERSLEKYLEEFCSKVIEIISFADWEKEYKRAKEGEKFYADLALVKSTPDTEVAPTKPTVTPPATSVHKVMDLMGVKSRATNSLEWEGMLGNVPCLVTLVNSKDHWQVEALPIKDVPVFPLLYCLANKAIEGYWQEEEVFNLIVEPINQELSRLDDLATKSQDPNKIEKIGARAANLQKLKNSVLNRQKLDSKVLIECTDIVKRAISEADSRPSITDRYFSRYILGKVYFLSQLEDNITYLLDDYMSHKRVPSLVQSALNWLKIVPRNLKSHFGAKKPSTKEIRDYLTSKFNSKFREVELKVREQDKKILLDIIYDGKVQLTQLLTIKMPATDGKNRGKVSTKVATTLNFSERNVFEKFLRVKDGRFVAEAQQQLRHLVNIFLSRSFSALVGEGKVGKQKKVAEIIGFERSKLGWSQIKNNFVKYMTPFSSDSGVDKGKLIWLNTGKLLSIQDLENLVVKIAENWSNWSRRNEEYIPIGNSQGMTRDPQCLVWVLTQKILTGDNKVDQIAWKHTLDWMCEITQLPIGLRASNGVILTPDALYSSHVDKWVHRIKIQLIDILLESQAGNIEAWLQKSPEYLYDAIGKRNSGWEATTSEDILKHLEAMHDGLNICLQIEESKY